MELVRTLADSLQALHGFSRSSQKRRSFRAPVLISATCAFLLSCAPSVDTTRPSFPFAASWQNTFPVLKGPIDAQQWWTGLDDPLLTHLIAVSLAQSPDLSAAQLRAEAALQQTGAIASLRTTEAGATGRRSGGNLRSENSAVAAVINLQAVVDLGRAREASALNAIARAGVAQAEASAARLLLIGEVSRSYLALRAAQQQLALVQRAQGRQNEVLRIAQDLLKEGEGTRIDTLRSQARIQAFQGQRSGIEADIEREILRLTFLIGTQPGMLPPDIRRLMQQQRPQPRPRLAPDPVVPADLVRNRPDLLIAEARYDGARAALGAARAELYPSLTISGMIDMRRVVATNPLTDTVESRRGNILNVGPSLRLPTLPLAASQASINAATTLVEAEYKTWYGAVLNALFEVESSLLEYRKTTAAETSIRRSVALQTESVGLLTAAFREGEATFAELAALQNELIDLELLEVEKRFDRARSFVDLHLRLGLGASQK